MNFIPTEIPGVMIIEPKRFGDERGYFMESFKKEEFDLHIPGVNFIQENESVSRRGVLRGLHLQKGEFSQAKLVRVSRGRVFDVAVDLRPSSPTFKQHVIVELSDENCRQLFVPRGFAHGFIVVSDIAQFQYHVDNVYRPDAEMSVRYDDPDLAIQWPDPGCPVLTSDKDLHGLFLSEALPLTGF